jgi:hypothetical protein
VLAAGATLGIILIIGSAALHPVKSKEDEQLLGVLFTLTVMLPSIIGLGIGLGAIDRRYKNPASLWAAAIWNGVILGVFLLLCIVGLMK